MKVKQDTHGTDSYIQAKIIESKQLQLGWGFMHRWADPTLNHSGVEHLAMRGKVIMKLVEGVQQKGHKKYCDNFYSFSSLFRQLTTLGFGACGIVGSSAAGLPNECKNDFKTRDLRKYYEKKVQLCLLWYENKQFRMLSTIHTTELTRKRIRSMDHDGKSRDVNKPVVIEAYNQNMGSIDKSDQMCMHEHRSIKWWKRVFCKPL